MKGIQLSSGVIFVEHEGITVRVMPNSACDLSPVLDMVVEWDLRAEPPKNWNYLHESQIKALDNDIYEKILAVVARVQGSLGT